MIFLNGNGLIGPGNDESPNDFYFLLHQAQQIIPGYLVTAEPYVFSSGGKGNACGLAVFVPINGNDYAGENYFFCVHQIDHTSLSADAFKCMNSQQLSFHMVIFLFLCKKCRIWLHSYRNSQFLFSVTGVLPSGTLLHYHQAFWVTGSEQELIVPKNTFENGEFRFMGRERERRGSQKIKQDKKTCRLGRPLEGLYAEGVFRVSACQKGLLEMFLMQIIFFHQLVQLTAGDIGDCRGMIDFSLVQQ
jgi:hypothetical protein